MGFASRVLADKHRDKVAECARFKLGELVYQT